MSERPGGPGSRPPRVWYYGAPPPRPRRWPYLLAAAGALLLVVVVYVATRPGGSSARPVAATPSPSPSPSPSPKPSPQPSPAASPAPTPVASGGCGPFAHPLDPLDPGRGTQVGEGAGCGAGQVGSFTTHRANWTVSLSYTCSGYFGPGGMGDSISVTPHNTATNSDLAATLSAGAWSHGVYLAGEGSGAPPGTYVIRIANTHPGTNQCQWHLAVFDGS